MDIFLYRSMRGTVRFRKANRAKTNREIATQIIYGISVWFAAGIFFAILQTLIPLGQHIWHESDEGTTRKRAFWGSFLFGISFLTVATALGLCGLAFGLPGMPLRHQKGIVAVCVVSFAAIKLGLHFGQQRDSAWLLKLIPWYESIFNVAAWGGFVAWVLKPQWKRGRRWRGRRPESFLDAARDDAPGGEYGSLESVALLSTATTEGEVPDERSYFREDDASTTRDVYDLLSVDDFHYNGKGLASPFFLDRTRDPWIHFALCMIFKVGIVVVYQVCVEFTAVFEHMHAQMMGKDALSRRLLDMLLFVIFTLIMTAFQLLFKQLGFIIDAGKLGSCPYYFMGDLFLLLNYYVFYRNLFSLVESGWTFALLQLVHLGYEYFKYVVRVQPCYYRATSRWWRAFARRWARITGVCCACCTRSCTPGDTLFASEPAGFNLTQEQWAAFVCAEYGLRIAVSCFSLFAYAIVFFLLRIGYNRKFYRFASDFSDEQFERIMVFCAISCVLEFLNAALVQRLFYRKKELDILQRLTNMLADSRFRLYTVLAAWIATINVMVGLGGGVPIKPTGGGGG